MLGILEKISPSELVSNGYISNHNKVQRPRPKFKDSFLKNIFLLFLKQCYSNKLWKHQQKIQRIISDSYFQLKSQFNVDARAPSIPLLNFPFNPNQTGGVESTPPSTFRAIISRKFFSAHRAFATFFFRVLRNFWCYFRKNRAYCSEVTERYVIERRLKIWEFSGFVYKTYGKWLFVLKIHFGF